MTRSKAIRAATLALAGLLLAACGSLAGMSQGFNAQLAGGYSTVTYARDSAGVLLEAGVIEADEAANVQDQADHLRAALDLARDIHSRDPATGTAKLEATLAALAGLRNYLANLHARAPPP